MTTGIANQKFQFFSYKPTSSDNNTFNRQVLQTYISLLSVFNTNTLFSILLLKSHEHNYETQSEKDSYINIHVCIKSENI